MRGRLTARIAAGLVAATLLAAPAPSSYAESQTSHDAAKDVYKQRANGTLVVARRDKARDIVRSKATYARGKLVLWTEVRNLASDDYAAWWNVKTNNGHWSVGFDKEDGSAYTSLFDGNQEVFDCDGLRGDTMRRKDRVIVKVPRSCIDRPRWVRFGTWVRHDTNTVILIDDGRLTAGFYTAAPKLGPRLKYN